MFPPLFGTGAPEMVAKALTRPKKCWEPPAPTKGLATGQEIKAHCQACGIATTASPNAESRRSVWVSTMAMRDGTDVVSKHQPSQFPPDRGVWHEIDLVPGTKYCVTRQWPLPRDQCEVIDAFFAEKAKSDMVRESKSPQSAPAFCVRKPNGKWRLVPAYNKLNNATAPAQTPIPRKDVLLNNMSGCTLYSALELGTTRS
ncbi:Pol protein [Phytophthora palmivora]|uniref:Pol protein n=1 Tax=Phytophthora palmivora TaxID=4796 RepID=A0A2P4XB53_9STRA|nr:Pol protein [Phytophthora palmivora]